MFYSDFFLGFFSKSLEVSLLLRAGFASSPYPENFEPPNKNIPLKPFLKKSDFINPFLLADSLRQDSIRLDSLIKIQTKQPHE